MKLSFSLQSKSSTKPNPKPQQAKEQNFANDDSHSKEFVTEFDATKTLNSKPIKAIIPPIQNEWRPTKRMKNLHDLPSLKSDGSRELQFETESISTTDHPNDDTNMSFGLNIRTADDKTSIRSSSDFDAIALQRLKTDLDRLPDDRGMEEFEDMAVEDFAKALLAGYGWKEGQGIGRNTKEDVQVMEIRKRTSKEGLGYDSSVLITPAPVDYNNTSHNRNAVSNGNSNRREEENVREKERVKDKYRDGFSVGTNVRVIAGGDIGSKGTIVERVGAERVYVKLSKSREEVKVRVEDIAHLGSKEEDRCLRKLKELKIQNGKDLKQSGHRDSEKQSGKQSSRDVGEVKVEKVHSKADTSSVSWLRSHIRVRVVSKDLKGGRLYLKKGQVVDVVGPNTCDVSMDESRELIQGVGQELLETALPKRGGPVLVLYGKHKGVYGSLVERDLDREIGTIRDADSHELLKVRLEQIAEYVGDPSYLGY